MQRSFDAAHQQGPEGDAGGAAIARHGRDSEDGAAGAVVVFGVGVPGLLLGGLLLIGQGPPG